MEITVNISHLIEQINSKDYKSATVDQKNALEHLVLLSLNLKLENIEKITQNLQKNALNYYYKSLSEHLSRKISKSKKNDPNILALYFAFAKKSSFFKNSEYNNVIFAHNHINEDINIFKNNEYLYNTIEKLREIKKISLSNEEINISNDWLQDIKKNTALRNCILKIMGPNFKNKGSEHLLKKLRLSKFDMIKQLSKTDLKSCNEILQTIDQNDLSKNNKGFQILFDVINEIAKEKINYTQITNLKKLSYLKGGKTEMVALLETFASSEEFEKKMILNILSLFEKDLQQAYNTTSDVKTLLVEQSKILKLSKEGSKKMQAICAIWEKEMLNNVISNNVKIGTSKVIKI